MKIVNMDYVRVKLPDGIFQFSTLGPVERVSQKLKKTGKSLLVSDNIGFNRITLGKQVGFLLYNKIFSSRILITIVNNQYAHDYPNLVNFAESRNFLLFISLK